MNTAAPLDPVRCRLIVSNPFRWVTAMDGDCEVLQVNVRANGYAVFWDGSGQRLAHRIALVAHLGSDLPPDTVVDHLCRVRACVTIAHLEIVTNDENIARGEWGPSNGYRGTCKNGHPLVRGEGSCKPCHVEWHAETHRLRLAAATKLGLAHSEYIALHGQGRRAAVAVLS